MKKVLVLFLFIVFAFCPFACARTKYDSTGRNVVSDGTIRGHKQQVQYERQRKMQTAAAAKINYNEKSSSQPVSDWAKKHTYKTFQPTPNYRYYQK